MINKYLGIALFMLFAILQIGCRNKPVQNQEVKTMVTVSILPQKFLVNCIAGDRVEVNVLLPKGSGHETYDPTIKQLKSLEQSKAYFFMGHLAFEEEWRQKLEQMYGQMHFADLSENLELIESSHHHHHEHSNYNHDECSSTNVDPHTWLSLPLLKSMLKNISQTLSEIDPEYADIYGENLNKEIQTIDSLHNAIKKQLLPLEGKRFYIFHPALSYFAQDYGLTQVALEQLGKEPTLRHFKSMVDDAGDDILLVFMQAEYDQDNIQLLASETKLPVVQINPMNEMIYEEIQFISQRLLEAQNNQHNDK